MNYIFKSTLLAAAMTFALSTISFAASTATVPATKDVAVGVNDVYVPGNLETNSDAFVVVSGLFPNGCYRWKDAGIKDIDNFNHEIQVYATVSQGMCIMVLVPFNKEIRFGRLPRGEHTLKFLNGDGTYLVKSLTIH